MPKLGGARRRCRGAILFVSLGGSLVAVNVKDALADRDPNQYVAFGDSITWGLESFAYPPGSRPS